MNIEIHGDVVINNSSGTSGDYGSLETILLNESDLDFLDGFTEEVEHTYTTNDKYYEDILKATKEDMKELQKKKQQIIGDYSKIVLNYSDDIDSVEAILTDFLDDYLDCF